MRSGRRDASPSSPPVFRAYRNLADFSDPAFNWKIREYLKDKLKGVTNRYLADSLRKLVHREIDVIGEQELLEPCPCCSYRTLSERGQYYVCPVCFWEDDGSDNEEKYSGPNKMTLQQARSNFLEIGVIGNIFVDSENKDAKDMYPRVQ